jgi:hypothetical protein
MLVTFRTKAYSNITMFGDVALKLLKLMGHSGAVPSAIKAEDVPQALARLEAAVKTQKAAEKDAPVSADTDGEAEAPVELSRRAIPLLELLRAAAKAKVDVMWDSR